MANLHAKRVMGNLVYYDRSYQQRWIRGEGVGIRQFTSIQSTCQLMTQPVIRQRSR